VRQEPRRDARACIGDRNLHGIDRGGRANRHAATGS
jgi:hypothetical protein